MARTARAGGPPPAPPPWHQRHRLLVQLSLLAALALIAAAIVAGILLGDDGQSEPDPEAVQQGLALRSLTSVIELAPADLPPGWTPLAAGPGFQGTLRGLDLGPATSVAESELGNARSWVRADDPRLLGVGLIVAQSPQQARAAFERLRRATPQETVAYVEPQAEEILAVTPRRLRPADDTRFGFRASFERGEVDPVIAQVEGQKVAFSVDALWAVAGRALLFVTLNDFFASPPLPSPVDLERWLDDLAAAYLEAEAALAAAGP